MSPSVAHQALYRRWRSQTFGEMVGQTAVVETLRNGIRTGQLAQAILLVGPRGTGKTSTARILAKALNCTNLQDGEPCDRCEACVAIREGRALDVVEMDAASHNKVDDIRELLSRANTGPSDLRRKVYIVDEVQRITQGWDVLLKTLEEPPDHVTFIFCTTEPGGIRPAVLSRVQRFDFRPLTVPEIEGKLVRVLEAEGRAADPDAISLVARLAAGGMRDAESMLDQLLTSSSGQLTADQVRELLGVVDAETVDAFIDALATGDALVGIQLLGMLEDRGRDLRSFLNQVVDGLRTALVTGLERGVGRDGSGARSGTIGRNGAPATAQHTPGQLAAAARRLAAIDPTRGGPGGLRFQLELALLAPMASSSSEGLRTASAPEVVLPSSAPTPTTPKPGRGETPIRSMAPAAEGPPFEAADGPPSEPPARSRATPSAVASPGPTKVPVAPSSGPTKSPVAPSPAPAAVPSESAPAGATDALLELQRHWPEIVAWISRNPPTKPLIAVCRPISVDGNVVTLGFPEGQAFLRDVAERRRGILEEGVAKFLGHAVAVRCVATNLEIAAPAPTDEEPARLLDAARRIFADDLVDIGEVS